MLILNPISSLLNLFLNLGNKKNYKIMNRDFVKKYVENIPVYFEDKKKIILGYIILTTDY